MKKFFLTFGIGHSFAKFVQPVLAKSQKEAEKAMHKVYGKEWGFCYLENNTGKEELPLFIVYEKMSLSEYVRWTSRFNNILEADTSLKNKRLKSLLDDLALSCDLNKDTLAKSLYRRTHKELFGSVPV